MKLKLPRGRRPNIVKEILAVEEDGKKVYAGCEVLLLCPTCGKWVTDIDCYFPYYMEMNRCISCGYFKDQSPSNENTKETK